MRMVFGLVLVLGLGLAGFAAYMAKTYIDGYQRQLAIERQQRAPNIETVDVYVAARPLAFGEALREKDVRLVAYPKTALPEGVFTKPEQLFIAGAGMEREVLRSMIEREVILSMKVTKPGEDAGITSRLDAGMRAFAIKVDATSGVSGFLRPGDLVDVYWTGSIGKGNMRTEGDSSGEVTKLIETRMKIIAVDQNADMDNMEARIARTVTVSATPQEVAALAQAQSTGRLALSLVGALDESLSEVIEVDQRRLLGLQAQVVEEPEPEAARCTVRTRRGAEVIETPIPCTN
ncbi:flagellar basal body P-ring biosynthesis protein FlgA [Roseovarius tolerans]|uniref:Flagellar basal body P-ring biosynthesis protein FlgA n=1 Tax=Roseovarius tolerans TaxID=74031 RepID=A0A0L6CR95_9RHOB|nr:Flp pilus assembly protein CpaB [Roseovarius tolerans]KNX40299.1 flagellar basal body P-ring biosynthesis protein FlgA [Roseovarius tolerans]